MKIGTIIRLISVSFVIIAISLVLLTLSNANEQKAVATQASFKQLGLDLSGASDFLTNQARAYVQYGESVYFDAYMNEVEVAKTREKVVAELTRLGAPQDELALVAEAAQLSNTLAELESRAFEAVAQGDMEAARDLMFGSDYENGKAPILETMQKFQNKMAERTDTAAESAKMQAQVALIIFSVLFAATAVIIIVSLTAIRKKMSLISKLADCATTLASGKLDIAIDTTSQDEVGVLAQSFKEMVNAIQKQVDIAERLADGDLTVDARPRSNEDAMGVALERMVDSLNQMFAQINDSTVQVSTGARQIANSSQSLAQGATEQASVVERLSGAIGEMAEKTKANAVMAEKAATLANTIRQNAEKGSNQMDRMTKAVKEINDASQSINKVIKVIDDIAFQTNILALNAAVEAARAGQHGKGFAVVADEVRNLAAKSAEAAKDTGALISNSMEKAELGARIAEETAASLGEIVSGIDSSSQIVQKIAEASKEQDSAITEVNRGIDQVAQVVQQNSATAEESAAASEEMSGQSDLLQGLVSQFELKSISGHAHDGASSMSSSRKTSSVTAFSLS
jgi:methyl-accepting chemotaxis protein